MKSVVFLCLLVALTACRSGNITPKKSTRKPLFSFKSDNDEPKNNGPQLFMGNEAKRYLENHGQEAVRGGQEPAKKDLPKPSIAVYKTPEELLEGLEKAPAHERADLLASLYELGEQGSEAVRQRQSELRFLLDSYEQILSQINEKKPKKSSTLEATAEPGVASMLDSEESRFLQEKFKLALDRFWKGDYLGARQLCNALIALAPGSVFTPKVRRLRRFARERMLHETVIHTELLGPRSVSTRKTLKLKLRLTNRTLDPLILVPSKGDRPGIGLLEVSYEELFPDGVRSRDQSVVNIAERKIISLKPGHSITLDINIPKIHSKTPSRTLGLYRIEGHLRPSQLLRGQQNLPYLIPIFERRVHVLNYKDLSLIHDPVASMKDSLESLDDDLHFLDKDRRKNRFKPKKTKTLEDMLRRLFITTVLAGERDRTEALKILHKVLQKAPLNVSRTLCSALSSILRDPYQYSKEEWLNWFAERGKKGSGRD